MSNVFVFVVCGAKEHIDTLHFALPYLKKFSKNEIWVVTDSKRNEIPVIHGHIIDIETPTELNNHQASIFLKTGFFQFVPTGNNYCYLDTDVIAFNEEVDRIFGEFESPIIFAQDHCSMPFFSPYSINCECSDYYNNYKGKLEKNLSLLDPFRKTEKESIVENRKKLVSIYNENNTILKKIFLGIRYILARKRFYITNHLYFDKKSKKWMDSTGEEFMGHFKWREVAKKSGLTWNFLKGHPKLPDGRNLWSENCNHLAESIEKKFNIKIFDKNFHHWNGGVFLFNNTSHDFLRFWHEATLTIFKDPYWKTRDQGTLIATVWKFGLQKHPTLEKKWNLIADYYKQDLKWLDEHTVLLSKKERIRPNFLHVYHHFGDDNWEFWTKIPKIEQ